MDKSKRIRHIVVVSCIPSAVIFLFIVFLIKFVEAGKLSSILAIILLLIVCAGVAACLIKLLTGMVECFSEVSKKIEQIASGEVKIEFRYHPKNEATKELLERIQKLVSEFVKIIAGIKKATQNLGSAVTELKDSFGKMSSMSENIQTEADKIADNAKSQADMTDHFIENIKSLGGSIDIITNQIDDLSVSAQTMKECNQNADKLMQDLVTISNQNGEAVQNINRQTLETNQSVQEIMEAVDIITSIAGQTNLLALNASIEAARAGDQGRGFAVVAEEIGTLAVQSKNSSEKIAKIVNSLIHNSNASVEITKQLDEAFSKQNEKIRDTEEIFGRLNKEIDNVSGAISEIDKEADAAKNQKDSMNLSIASLKETVETNVESVENTVTELKKFESMVSSCTQSTKTVSDVSSELVGYLTDISEKKGQIKAGEVISGK